ncbi:MAG: hypothetical protein EA412_04660 [Chitinophagaceae bacterium]|nr:MAG: hypothetical protein EA412_04660 [Chitinophagaceae bacterium]
MNQIKQKHSKVFEAFFNFVHLVFTKFFQKIKIGMSGLKVFSLIFQKIKVAGNSPLFLLTLFAFSTFSCSDSSKDFVSETETLSYTKPKRLTDGPVLQRDSMAIFLDRSSTFNFEADTTNPLWIQHDTSLLHQAVMTPVWDILNLLEYEREYINGTPWYVPRFPREIRELEGTVIELKGYMVPMDPGIMHDNFLISVLPLMQCHFCGQGGIPEMVEVFSNRQIRYTESIISIKGRLRLNDSDEKHFTFILDEASLL